MGEKMELPHIGTHCQLKSCNRLDYLPFKCNHCSLNFCESHWKPDQHECSKFVKENTTSTEKPQESTSKAKPEKPKTESVSTPKLFRVQSRKNELQSMWRKFLYETSFSRRPSMHWKIQQ